ncbi:hypothetical protein [Collimonas humicola]|uniref:hypothetical protein n=1 Tax=Collimonas humicola TaxID=2825886 RepID=UPI001B8B2ACA|nr:hypothetical protein [Collimonas humicola]
MTTNPPVTAEVRERIHFETLLTQAEQVLATYARSTWTDTAEHDPGITLLQALCYNTSDLAYRHLLPLVDLLTPATDSDQYAAQEGVFPASFGPGKALTSGPITADDYRRKLLDLRGSHNFYFRNAQLQPERGAQQYTYYCDLERREFVFRDTPMQGEDAAIIEELRVAGTYHLYLEPNRNIARPQAEAALATFLENNRNLCEAVRNITWLESEDVNVYITVEVDDDCIDPAAVMAQIFVLTEATLSSAPARFTATELAQQGLPNEEIYNGPQMDYGRIPTLPPDTDYSAPRVLNISLLANALLSIEAVKSIRHLGFTQESSADPVWTKTVAAEKYLLLWGGDPYTTMLQQVKLLKRGQALSVSEEDIEDAVPLPEWLQEPQVIMPYGRYRNPDRYYYAAQRLPPCYGLLEPTPDPQQIQLHQFLLPFEQQIANGCDQLRLLPELLSFIRGIGDPVVWGGKWPLLPEDSPAAHVHAAYADDLERYVFAAMIDAKKELAIVDYLLGYFGSGRASRTLWVKDDIAAGSEFLEVQQRYLQQNPALAYGRASIRVDQVSAVQRRIAARLGIGAEMFAYPENVDNLPFYIVEHRALLPVEPNHDYDDYTNQTPIALVVNIDAGTLTITVAADLEVGQLIDLVILKDEVGAALNEVKTTIAALMVRSATPCNGSDKVVVFHAADSQQLTRNLADLEELFGDGKVRWQNAQAWLQFMSYRAAWSENQKDDSGTELPTNQGRLQVVPFPASLKAGDHIIFEKVISAGGAEETNKLPTVVDNEAVVTAMEALEGTIVVENVSGEFPDLDTEKYIWYQKVEAAVDQFSFSVSVVFKREEFDVAEPEVKLAWFAEVVREELPMHVRAYVLTLNNEAFAAFAANYAAWHGDGKAWGDRAYELLEALTIGKRPSMGDGIGVMRIATDAQAEYPWDPEYIAENELFYVPPT